MLSNVEVLLLSIVNEKPSYAYEIDKAIDHRDMRRWVRVGVASIYQVLKRLEEKDFVYSKKEKEGRMPDRKRYYITDTGKAALVEASKRLLSGLEWYYLDLNIGFETSDLLSPEEIANCLIKRLFKVQLNIKKLKEMYLSQDDTKFKKNAVIKSLIYLREAEEKFLQEIIQELSTSIHQ
ncbi:putative transcriptional regulator [Desulfoscipio gibsoniae DSM 7213]|uniref:Putative transcriptional regulator n=2 Tax=Desulfoscipio gibsoniae TaxID=102134 RepID=R4KNV7_9FIRM|nr:putative transcriptional regulator [Desulfoscipio gibsoniae DSM 7213]